MTSDHEEHYDTVITAMAEGRVIPLLGAGVNLCGRPSEAVWQRKSLEFLPSGGELAEFLAGYFRYPKKEPRDLARVSQWAAVMSGTGPLYSELHDIFDVNYEPGPLHRFLAQLPARLKERGCTQYQLIMTTNYDDALERAFVAAGEPFDLVSYIADGEHRGKCLHQPPDGEARVIEDPNQYLEISLEQRTVIVKIHGAVHRNRGDAENDSYVITEDHYIDYLTRTEISGLLPATLAAKLRRSHFLFLGYSMRDWNLRVILHRIWGQQKLSYRSWSIQSAPERIEREFWNARGVEICDIRLEDYVEGIDAWLQEELGAGIVP